MPGCWAMYGAPGLPATVGAARLISPLSGQPHAAGEPHGSHRLGCRSWPGTFARCLHPRLLGIVDGSSHWHWPTTGLPPAAWALATRQEPESSPLSSTRFWGMITTSAKPRYCHCYPSPQRMAGVLADIGSAGSPTSTPPPPPPLVRPSTGLLLLPCLCSRSRSCSCFCLSIRPPLSLASGPSVARDHGHVCPTGPLLAPGLSLSSHATHE